MHQKDKPPMFFTMYMYNELVYNARTGLQSNAECRASYHFGYGQPSSPALWNSAETSTIQAMGFEHSQTQQCDPAPGKRKIEQSLPIGIFVSTHTQKGTWVSTREVL